MQTCRIRTLLIAALVFAAGCSRAPESRPAAAPEPPSRGWFTDVAPAAGIRFQHITGATGQFYMPEIMGPGCALLDADNDGDLDVFLIQGSSLTDPASGPGNRYYRNEFVPSGSLRFTDATEAAGLAHAGYGMGAATGDFDSDGHTDLLLTQFGGNVLYRNRGDGTFEDVTARSPDVAMPGRWSTSASFFDYDRDGRQDLAILEYMDYSLAANKRCQAPSGEITYCTPRVYRTVASRLFHNEGGRFVEATRKAGLDRALGRGLGVVALDANADGWDDLFVANDASANHLFLNRGFLNHGGGAFREAALELGVAYSEDGLAKAGMGIAAGDYDNDGDEDLAVLNLMREGATLFRNEGRTGFTDVSRATTVHALSFLFTGFGTGWLDADNDGWLDLFLANGAVMLREEQRGQPYPFRERNLLLRNPGAKSRRFTDATRLAGPDFEHLEVSRGAAFGDVDNDGDIDILMTNNNGPARLLRNDAPRRDWLQVKATAGATVRVKAAGAPPQFRRVRTDGSYLSASDPRAHFGLGSGAQLESVTVAWPDGRKRTYEAGAVRVNSVLQAEHVTQQPAQND